MPAVALENPIQSLNDRFRKGVLGMLLGEITEENRRASKMGRLVMTRALRNLPPETQIRAMAAVRDFEAFTQANDPYQEHDFASLVVDGVKLMFKLDYYDKAFHMGSEDPADPNVTGRLLTILLTSDY